jgi:hypothetical protein
VSAAPAFLSLTIPNSLELDAISTLGDRLTAYSSANEIHEDYYEGTHVAKRYGFSIPPVMQGMDVVAGWGGTVVDVLEERLDWLGWRNEGEDFGLGQIYRQNALDSESGMAHLDALIFGISFVTVGSGSDGEPSPLITPQSPQTMTCEWDARSRVVRRAVAESSRDDGGQVSGWVIYHPDETTYIERQAGRWVVIDRDTHRLGRVPVVAVRNRVRGSRQTGRSEISAAVRYYTDAAVRTMLGMEVHREFYQAPQRWAMDVDPDRFMDAEGNRLSPWQSVMGRVWMVPPNDDPDVKPSVGQFTPSSPAPYLEQVRGLAQMLAAEAGIPATYLGFATDNPASADAIRAGEARLVKRAERRQTVFGSAWLEVAKLALLVRDGSIPDDFDAISVRWRDAATPTRAAAADEATKLVGAGILSPDSTVTYDRVGLAPDEQRVVMADKRRGAGRAVLAGLADVAGS